MTNDTSSSETKHKTRPISPSLFNFKLVMNEGNQSTTYLGTYTTLLTSGWSGPPLSLACTLYVPVWWLGTMGYGAATAYLAAAAGGRAGQS